MTAPAVISISPLIPPRKIACAIISDNMDAATKGRISYLTRMLEKIAAANKEALMFSHVAIYFHKNEIFTPSPIFALAKSLGLSIIVDTFNSDYKQSKTPAEYQGLILKLQDLGVSMGRIDDANTLPRATLPLMLPDVPGWRWILSTGVHDTPIMASLAQSVDSDVKVTSQTYLNGAKITYLQKWLKDIQMWGVDFETYKDDSGYMTTPDEITAMGNEVILAKKRIINVYALKDQNTDFLAPEKINGKPNPKYLGKQWEALRAFLKRFWAEV